MKVAPASRERRRGTNTIMDDLKPIEDDRDKLQILLKNIQPFILTLKILSGYFETWKDDKHTASANSFRQRWNFWRIYSTLILILSWADALRYCAAFTGRDGFGPGLFMKLFYFILVVVIVFCRTTSYIACSCGTVHKTLTDISSLHLNIESVRKFTRYLTAYILYGAVLYFGTSVYQGMFYRGSAIISTYQIEPFASYFTLSNNQNIIANVIVMLTSILVGPGAGSNLFLGFFVSYVLCREFQKIKTELRNLLQTENGNLAMEEVEFENLRKRHQSLTDILRNTDKYVCTTNGAFMISMISTTILVLYSVCFYTRTFNDIGILLSYGTFLIGAIFSLVGMLGSAIMINEAVMSHYNSPIKYLLQPRAVFGHTFSGIIGICHRNKVNSIAWLYRDGLAIR